MQRERHSRPCPGGCGSHIDLEAHLCWACRKAEGEGLAQQLPALMGARDMNAMQLANALGIQSARVRKWMSRGGMVPRAFHDDIRFVLGASAPPPPPRRADRPLFETVRVVEAPLIVKPSELPLPAPQRRPRWELYCLLCGRGTGPGGVLVWTRILPTHADPCRYCGGQLLARELFTERDLEAVHGMSRRAA